MAKRTCFGCGIELGGDVATLEDILPKWLAAVIKQPNVKLILAASRSLLRLVARTGIEPVIFTLKG